jgi:hypothetical protein
MVASISADLAAVLAEDEPAESAQLLEEAQRLGGESNLARFAGPAPPAPAVARPSSVPDAARLIRDGDIWTFEIDGRMVRLRDGKGVRHLAVLLARPGVETHSLELAGGAIRPGLTIATTADDLSRADSHAGAGPALDAAAKSAYRRRLEDLRDELEEAERFNDPERATRAREEIEFLAGELAAAVGLGGRDRPQSSDAERARVNVTRAIRTTIRRIADHDRALGAELEATVHTGLFCRYEPDPRRPVLWSVDGG